MKTTLTLSLTIAASIVWCPQPVRAADEAPKGGPVQAFQKYCAALKKKDIPTADALTARSPKLHVPYITNYNTVFSRRMRIKVFPEAFTVKGDCAAVLCEVGPEGSAERRRAFLIRQDGTWKVCLKFWLEKNAWYPLEGKQKEDAAAVEKWCSERLKKKPKP